MLASKRACNEQRDVFAAEWPEGAAVTLENCRRAAELDLNLSWLAQHFLSAPAWKAYQEATAPAWKAYQEATAPAWKAYQEATATAWKAYQEATATAEKAYQEATATAEKAYQEATATAFFSAWCLDHPESAEETKKNEVIA
jgi:hypothetical protein